MKEDIKILKGNIIFTKTKDQFEIYEHGSVISVDNKIIGVYQTLPEKYAGCPIEDYGDCLIIPGLTDLHIHASQYAFRGLGMDMELLEWLETNTFPEEAKYHDMKYAQKAYAIFVENLRKGATTRACIFATVHRTATLFLMDLLEASGIDTFTGKVNMDRNCPDYLCEKTEQSYEETKLWLLDVLQRSYKNTKPILTPRFIPTCTDDLLEKLKQLQMQYHLPLQSHLSENPGEIDWVQELCPQADFYGDAYDRFGLFGTDSKTVMAHCVYSDAREVARMKKNGVYVAHCPESNMNLSSGIAPVRTFLEQDLHVGIGSDVAGGAADNLFTVMAHTIQSSKLRWRLFDHSLAPLTASEVFYMASKGGGAFFGSVGSFEPGYELDAIVLDDKRLAHPQPLSVQQRLERLIYLADDREIYAKYVAGEKLF